MGIQWSVYTTTTIIMMKSIFFAALVAEAAPEAGKKAKKSIWYGQIPYSADAEPKAEAGLLYSGLNNYATVRSADADAYYGYPFYGGVYPPITYSAYAAPAYTGYGNLYGAGYGARYLGKRSADAEPEADAFLLYNGYNTLGYGYAGLNNYAAVRSYAAAPVVARSYAAAPVAAYAAPAYTAGYATGYSGYGSRYGLW